LNSAKGVIGIAILVLVIAGWTFSYFYSEPRAKSEWMSTEARNFVHVAMMDFCKDFNNGKMCVNSLLTGKSTWILSSRFANSRISISDVDNALTKQGWATSKVTEKLSYFCKGERTAAYERVDEFVTSISFLGGSNVCRTRNQR
jgi:hypothetical protein